MDNSSLQIQPGSDIPGMFLRSYPRHLEVGQDTPRLAAEQAPVADLCRAGVGVHLCELQLGLCACPGGERRVADNISQGLSVHGQTRHLLETFR